MKKGALGEHMSTLQSTSDFNVCNICNLSFINRLGLEDPSSYDHKIKIEENSDLFFSAATDTKPFIKEENKEYLFDDQKCTTFNCKFCDEIFVQKIDDAKHISSHHQHTASKNTAADFVIKSFSREKSSSNTWIQFMKTSDRLAATFPTIQSKSLPPRSQRTC